MSDLNVPKRNAISSENTWNADSLFTSIPAWEKEYRDIESGILSIAAGKEKINTGPGELLKVINEIEDSMRRTEKLYVYASMAHSVDMQDQAAAAIYDRVQNLVGKVSGAAAYLEPVLLSIGREKIDGWMKEEPGLTVYRHYLDNLFRKSAHVRSAEVEEIMGMIAGPFSSPNIIHGSLVNADLKFKPAVAADGREYPVTQSSIDAILDNPDRELRRTGWENYMDAHIAFKNSLANTLSASVKQDVFDMSVRKHKSTLEASLFEDNIPVEVFHNLIETFKKNLPTWHRYWRLRRRVLGVETLHPYDIWAPLTDAKPRIEYRQALEFIAAGLEPLGKDYINILRRGCTEDRWVDFCPCQGKTAGAFSSGCYGTYPFICMSFTDDVNSLSTLTHELGHSMHSYMTWQRQPYVYSRYSIFVAEVASNFHQAMVRAHLLKTINDPGFQIAVLEEAMSNFHRYFFIMPTLARFELEVHRRVERGEGLTAEDLNTLMVELFSEGYGGEMHIDRERVGITWATFVHLFYDYYVFQYGTGISAAHALSNRILNGAPGAAEDYLKFLSAGGSVYPLDVLKLAGVDLTTPKAVEETFGVLEGYVQRLEKLLII